MKKFWENAYIFSFEARLKEVIREENRLGLIFDETYFFPEGGGQPADRGTVGGFPVSDVQEVDEVVIHYLPRDMETETYFSTGQTFPGEVDRDFRIHNMRLHTGSHTLFGAARKMFANVGYAGFNIGEVGNLYLKTDRLIRSDDLREMAQMANEIVVEDREVSSRFVNNEETGDIDGLAYNLQMPKGQVRIITVDGWDVAACCGTHVASTVGIGPIKVVARELHKKNVTRIDFAVGKRAVAEMANDERYLLDTAELLSTSRDQIHPVVQKMSGEMQGLQKDLRKMRERLADYQLSELLSKGEVIGRITLFIGVIDFLDAGAIRMMATKLLADRAASAAVIVAGSGDLSLVAACTPDLELPLAQRIVPLAKKYGGGGGGRPNFITAGGIQANAGLLADELRSELVRMIEELS
jgi:alanyl-tRNA synthetase